MLGQQRVPHQPGAAGAGRRLPAPQSREHGPAGRVAFGEHHLAGPGHGQGQAGGGDARGPAGADQDDQAHRAPPVAVMIRAICPVESCWATAGPCPAATSRSTTTSPLVSGTDTWYTAAGTSWARAACPEPEAACPAAPGVADDQHLVAGGQPAGRQLGCLQRDRDELLARSGNGRGGQVGGHQQGACPQAHRGDLPDGLGFLAGRDHLDAAAGRYRDRRQVGGGDPGAGGDIAGGGEHVGAVAEGGERPRSGQRSDPGQDQAEREDGPPPLPGHRSGRGRGRRPGPGPVRASGRARWCRLSHGESPPWIRACPSATPRAKVVVRPSGGSAPPAPPEPCQAAVQVTVTLTW